MAKPRCQQISLQDTPFYHCTSRCVRRAFLCGKDNVSGQSFEHRRIWIEKRIFALSKTFAIHVCAYAVMTNHTHLVLSVDIQKAKLWTDREVVMQWHRLFKGTMLTQQFIKKGYVGKHLKQNLDDTVDVYRKRLIDISWFMKSLNEPIARMANEEDKCTGKFWEERYKSQALLDETALLSCMVYVDLNPIRAAIAKAPESSQFTSISLRCKEAKKQRQPKQLKQFKRSNALACQAKIFSKGSLDFDLKSYLELVDLTGRCIVEGKKGVINTDLAPILVRLNINQESWLHMSQNFEQWPSQSR